MLFLPWALKGHLPDSFAFCVQKLEYPFPNGIRVENRCSSVFRTVSVLSVRLREAQGHAEEGTVGQGLATGGNFKDLEVRFESLFYH